MKDLKKLFKRDKMYWLLMAVLMLILITYNVLNKWEHALDDELEWAQQHKEFVTEMWELHPENREEPWMDLTNGFVVTGFFIESNILILMLEILALAFVAQAIRLLVQETKNRTEVQSIFPVKERSNLTYYYISGVLLMVIPAVISAAIILPRLLYVEHTTDLVFEQKGMIWVYIARTLVLFLVHYSLLILCRRVTNHIPGAVFTFGVLELGLAFGMGYANIDIGLYALTNENRLEWGTLIVLALLMIFLSYLADKKKDRARNGFYAFPIVHWIMMAIIYVETCFIFYGAYENIPKIISRLIMLLGALIITAGVHFIVRPKKTL